MVFSSFLRFCIVLVVLMLGPGDSSSHAYYLNHISHYTSVPKKAYNDRSRWRRPWTITRKWRKD